MMKFMLEQNNLEAPYKTHYKTFVIDFQFCISNEMRTTKAHFENIMISSTLIC